MLIGILGVLLLAMGIPALFLGVCNAGNLVLICGGMLCILAFCCRRPLRTLLGRRYMKMKKIGKGVVYTGCILLAAGCALLEIGGHHPPDTQGNGADQVLIVLGAQVKGDQPGMTLRNRLDAACTYLQHHPQSVCIVSGGQGADEQISEAQAMYTYLRAKGIAPERILREDQASSTRENISASLALMERAGLQGKQVILVSDSYHLLRARMLAGRAGVDAATLAGRTHPLLEWPYRVRELFALAKDAILTSFSH